MQSNFFQIKENCFQRHIEWSSKQIRRGNINWSILDASIIECQYCNPDTWLLILHVIPLFTPSNKTYYLLANEFYPTEKKLSTWISHKFSPCLQERYTFIDNYFNHFFVLRLMGKLKHIKLITINKTTVNFL